MPMWSRFFSILFVATCVGGCAELQQATDDGSGGDGTDAGESGSLTGAPPPHGGVQDDGGDAGGTAGTDGGEAGDAGDAGDAGEAGDAGDAGDAGEAGDAGDADAGDAGEAGDAGDSGAAGDAGDSGDAGDAGGAGDASDVPTLPCADANLGSTVPLTDSGSTVGAGDELTASAACSDGNGEDLVLQWTAPADGIYRIDTVGSDFDTILYMIDGCDTPTELQCDDDISTSGQNLSSLFGIELSADQTVLIVVDGYDVSGNYVVNIEAYDPDGAAGLTGFGDCIGGGMGECVGDEFCLNDGSSGDGICSQPCNELSDCPDATGSGTAQPACLDVTANGLPECVLDCQSGESCPASMFCYADYLCMF